MHAHTLLFTMGTLHASRQPALLSKTMILVKACQKAPPAVAALLAVDLGGSRHAVWEQLPQLPPLWPLPDMLRRELHPSAEWVVLGHLQRCSVALAADVAVLLLFEVAYP